jgi:signal transduction histidine kinase
MLSSQEMDRILPGQRQFALLALLWLLPVVGLTRLPGPTHFNPLSLPLAFIAIVADLQARRIRGFGVVSTAHACILALVLWPEAGPALAVATACLSAIVRLISAGGPFGLRSLEFFCATFPAGYGAVVVGYGHIEESWLRAIGVLLVYTGLTNVLPMTWGSALGREWEKEWHAWTPFQRGVNCLGVGLSFLASSHPWACLCAFPLLLSPNRVVDSPGMLTLRNLNKQLDRTGVNLDTVSKERARLEVQLSSKVDEFCLVQEVSTALAQAHDLMACCDQVLSAAQRITRASTVAYYRFDGSGLSPVRFLGASPQRLEQFHLLQLQEPIVEHAWKAGQMVCQGSQPVANRPVPAEAATVALHLGEFGVLYAGRAHPGFTMEECQLLRILQDQATVAFYACSRLVGYKQGLELLTAAHRKSRWWARRRARLLKVCRRISTTHSTGELGLNLSRLVGRIVPHQQLYFHWKNQDLTNTEPDQRVPLEPLLAALGRSRRPLLIPDLARFAPGSEEGLKVIAYPLMADAEWCGTLILVGTARSPWRRSHLHILGVLTLQLQATLRQLDLNEQIAQAYADLQASQAHLVQSSKMAAVGLLAAGIAHEVNTPLAVIKMGVTAARRLVQENPERVTPRLDHALVAVEKAETIIQRLLFYSREGSAGERAVQLQQVAQDTALFLAHHLSLQGVQIHSQYHQVAEIQANPNELQQVVTNLVLNACDALQALPAPDRHIELATFERESEVCLLVRDSGPGIPQEVRDRVFEPFFTTKEVGQGTGLGLFISTQIVERYGGRLELLPSPKGAAFQLSFPCQNERITRENPPT